MSEKLPQSIMQGDVKIGNVILKCHTLEDGTAIIEEESFIAFFKAMKEGTIFDGISQAEIEEGVKKLKSFSR